MRSLALAFFALMMILAAPRPGLSGCSPEGSDVPRIAPWYGGRSAAASLRFDDNLESHLDIALPMMNRMAVRGTFMVSPGRRSFMKRREEWLGQVPALGHELGNHTMNHRGAGSLAEAEYEIGEAAKILREAGKRPDRLLLFASGGGKRWGGKRWSESDRMYRDIPGSLDMIDLYDGNYPYVNVTGDLTPDQLIGYVDRAIVEGRHQAFTFHGVGAPSIRDHVRRLIRGKDLAFPEEKFLAFLRLLKDRSEKVWIAPLGDILKYRGEYEAAALEGIRRQGDHVTFRLVVGTDPVLFDHPLTVVLPWPEAGKARILQDGKTVEGHFGIQDLLVFDLSPVTSFVSVGPAPPALVQPSD